MKTRFFKFNPLLLVAFVVALVTMSFKTVENDPGEQVFYYQSSDTSEGAFGTVANWDITPTATCVTTGERPCKISVPSGQSLQNIIGGMSNDDILDLHPLERKP